MFFKQAASRGVGPWRTALVANTVAAIGFLALWPMGGTLPAWSLWWQPLIVAFTFIGGQLLTFLALEKGDVSIVTPVMGIKLLLVALLMTLLMGSSVRLGLWIACVLGMVGVALLHRSPHKRLKRNVHVGRTILMSMGAGVCYAFFDVLIMKWAPAWGPGRFLPVVMLLSAVLSLGFLPLMRAPITAIVEEQWRPLLAGAIFMCAQAMTLITTLAISQDGTAVNVIYNLRGLWSVAAVWWVGHWFGNVERAQGAETMRNRLLGALALSVAVVLVFV